MGLFLPQKKKEIKTSFYLTIFTILRIASLCLTIASL